MGKFSTYRYLELKDDTAAPHINIRSRNIKHPRKLKKIFIFLIVLALCITYFLDSYICMKTEVLRRIRNEPSDCRFWLLAGQSQWLDGIAKSLGYESVYHHAVIIDAGSSGSRVIAYKFRVPLTLYGPSNLDLVEEFFEQSKPGLSSYADDPAKGADTIVQLIKKAEFLTPPEKRKSTPLIVRATAGLRLLPADKAQQLIDHVARAIMQLGYDVAPDGVKIMDGSDEGIFIWYTINLLHNLIGGTTMAALDLGGGSTQITYQLSDKETANFPKKDQYVVPAGENITLYTHSYLKLGLLAARYGVFQTEASQADTQEFRSVCVDPIIQREPWTYANKNYFVSGAFRVHGSKRAAIYSACHAVVRRSVLPAVDWEPRRAPLGSIAAMSYFYDVAADAGIIDVMTGGQVSVAAYRKAALEACSTPNVDQPWACIDLVYIVTLLQDVYKISDEEPVYLFKKVNGHEVSWALGLAYTTIMNRIVITP
ncbi:ectonucleoside triphosphate diphosphohydrolase 5 isoform X3 [Spodoptera frugiperda]|uniref:Ectonucleoside triphosphate diphosphohydrolase 5 isoform X3 n=1 Tax=Spodoptera frugiperda TaxID=7108 RepID=A0A9R0EYR9_SPOFR|nr:ectonucleoside triphosphate diphosphohydrolase 5 isoform X3 [Spodoptera frugiperda]